jgi:hypothetical protein
MQSNSVKLKTFLTRDFTDKTKKLTRGKNTQRFSAGHCHPLWRYLNNLSLNFVTSNRYQIDFETLTQINGSTPRPTLFGLTGRTRQAWYN